MYYTPECFSNQHKERCPYSTDRQNICCYCPCHTWTADYYCITCGHTGVIIYEDYLNEREVPVKLPCPACDSPFYTKKVPVIIAPPKKKPTFHKYYCPDCKTEAMRDESGLEVDCGSCNLIMQEE